MKVKKINDLSKNIAKKDTEMLVCNSPGRLTAMVEDDAQSEISEAHSEQVKRFLQELLDETNQSKNTPANGTKPAKGDKIKMAVMNFA